MKEDKEDEIQAKPNISGKESDEENMLNIDLSDKKSCSPTATATEGDVLIETIEGEIGKKLLEKAEKTNLTVNNVKSIIRQVLTNEHVLALLHKENQLDFPEPKLTRAKAKELLSSNPLPIPQSWAPQPPVSETRVLVTEELPEDSSGDEYIPGEDEENDENDDSMASESDTSSLPPPTPPSIVPTEDHSTQTNWTEDGVFKIPPNRSGIKYEDAEIPIIALRTRSKINLSSTPLEVIENSFVPPDITTDMYDMECDDEEWKEFLNGFTKPLEVAVKPTEDEDHDPEYNILAEYEEIEKVEKIERKEEFRDDKAVTITKKEVKELWEELFEYIQNLSNNDDQQEEQDSQNFSDSTFLNYTEVSIQSTSRLNSTTISESEEISCSIKEEVSNATAVDETINDQSAKNIAKTEEFQKTVVTNNSAVKTVITVMSPEQIGILEQQIRQHIQMLTQNFLLMYKHPEYHNYSERLMEYLLNFKFLNTAGAQSIFQSVNLEPALKLIDYWTELFKKNAEEVKECKAHMESELAKSVQCSMAGNFNYIPTFPQLFLKTLVKSEVFLYPALLPKIPYKSKKFCYKKGFTESEDMLLAFELDHFATFLRHASDMKKIKNRQGEVQLKILVSYIQQYVMPHRNEATITRHIRLSKDPRCAENPIKRYFLRKKIAKIIHYIQPQQTLLPPYKRTPEELPIQIRNFLFPAENSGRKNISSPMVLQNLQSFPITQGQPIYVLNPSPISVQNLFLVTDNPQATDLQNKFSQTPLTTTRQRKASRKMLYKNPFQHNLKESLKKCSK